MSSWLSAVKNRSERYPAQHTTLADAAQLGMVVSVHANQATAEHRPPGGRNQEETGRTGKTQGSAGQGGENEERAGGAKCRTAAEQERSLLSTSGSLCVNLPRTNLLCRPL